MSTLRITHVEPRPALEIESFSAASGGGRTERRPIPVLRAHVEGLPAALDGVYITSDLQGRERADASPHDRRLTGLAVAEALAQHAEHVGLPHPDRAGVVLAGDLFAYADLRRRGGLGDVQEVWRAFGERFRWVVGVAGNHDTFEGRADTADALEGVARCEVFDGSWGERDGLRLGGVSGVIGAAGKPWRRDPPTFERLCRALPSTLDVLVFHQGPDVPREDRPGHELARQVLRAHHLTAPLVICGHVHWREPLATLPHGQQVLNVDSRVIALVRA